MLGNAEIARKLNEIRTLMELAGEPFFKFTAYERAATAVENAAPVSQLIASGELQKVPGIGKSIAATIAELCEGGSCSLLTELYARFPPTIFELLSVSGIGTKTAAILFEQYGIGSVADLEAALESGTLSGAPRMGPKTLDNIRRGILAYKGRTHRTPLAAARAIGERTLGYLRDRAPLDRISFAGSVRRAEATVGDVDIVCTSVDAPRVIQTFVGWDLARAVLADGPTKGTIWLDDGLQIDLRVLPDELYGNLLQHFTGSREHNIQLREYAVRKGLRVSENGILELESGRTIICRTEAEVYEALGMEYIPPELRSGSGEIEAARDRTLPQLIELSDVRGDFHMHSTWSDGRDALEDMIAAAASRGYEYHSISDHSQGRGRIGLSPEWLLSQRAEIEAVSEKHGITTLHSSEVDIRSDGSLDYDDETLAKLDIVVGSVHSAMQQSRDEMTRRLIRACENPYLNIIGHPTGRMIEIHPGYEFDYDAVFAAAARTGTALEIDGQGKRLDLPAALARRAKDFGVVFTVDSDAHDVAGLDNVALAVSQARRAWLTRDNVVNTWPLEDVRAFVRRKRAAK
ncbi:MAG: DNA polymerase/3'-5' exonuclease PolX [Candidatus Eremiobacteraeota bacterium]|nr:DNA polymerase/3'-5' exonuclease PolX [Candidatus Eremiobacteraeota bacterium]